MIVTKLTLKNFRNYDDLQLEFSPGLNIIVGDNASGKTNIVEAIQFLSLARSFRTSNISDLIKKRREFATIDVIVEQDTIKKDIVALLAQNSKKITINGKPIAKISELAKSINVIIFEPEDTSMFKKPPSVRREFFDINISKKYPLYLDSLIVYNKLLKERNLLLKEENVDMLQLDVVTSRMVKVEKEIITYRKKYVDEINSQLSRIISIIRGEDYKAKIHYYPFMEIDEDFEAKALDAYQDTLEQDLAHKVTSIGVQRDIYQLYLNGNDISKNGSQGENRIAAIALKVAPYFISENSGHPIVVLDDVMSELDNDHKERLIAFLREIEQVFITSTSTDIVDASIYEVTKEQKVIRRNS